MAKWYGVIGFAITAPNPDYENHPGVWDETLITEKPYYGDILQNNRRYEASSNLNDDLNIRNEFSILADPFAMEHFSLMRYLTWLGARWKITDVKVDFPRMTLTVGGVYNGPTP